jgi:hypothetical protein
VSAMAPQPTLCRASQGHHGVHGGPLALRLGRDTPRLHARSSASVQPSRRAPFTLEIASQLISNRDE